MLWSGGEPTPKEIIQEYKSADRRQPGVWQAFRQRVSELEAADMPAEKAIHTAYEELPAEERMFGEFHWYQLITNGFLHGGLLHLAGNLLFLLVLGSRVNALIGQWKTALVYPVLLVLSSGAQFLSMSGQGAQAALGASGAIMGLAGMYFVLFPVHRIFLVIWFRFTLWIFVPIWWTRVFYKIWAIRGFWVVLTFISFDVLATVLGSSDSVAHWAHLGGFIAGMFIALALLLARQIDANGGDLITVLLGRRAWALIGKPAQRHRQPEPAPAAA
jgi:membrane associated rhomboid family serine protease